MERWKKEKKEDLNLNDTFLRWFVSPTYRIGFYIAEYDFVLLPQK